MPVLDFVINRIGSEIEMGKDSEDFGKDDEYHNPSWSVNGITNGELFYSLYRTILKMTQESEFEILELPLSDQQAFASTLDLAIVLFLDSRDPQDPDQGWVDLWILHLWCCRLDDTPDLYSEDETELSITELSQLTGDDWNYVAESVKCHFLDDSDVDDIEMALLDEQPHWPTHQEFRKAKAWLFDWYEHTRWNSK